MAVDDFFRDTDAFVLPSKSYYPLRIPIDHYQLRHLISSPEPDLLYYASAKDIYCLNVATKTQAKIASLTWEARCTASGYGYVCVGCHDNATVAIIKVKGFPPADPTDVDALLPLHFLSRTTLPRPPRLASPSQPKYETIGDDIVNSISIHKLPNSGDRQDDVVAVLTNNDKSVRIFSLKEHKLVATLRMSFPMNHATISPDGQLLVAVGDKHIGYFFKRTQNNRTAKTVRTTEEQADPPDWTLIQEVSLYVPSDSSLVGYFATAWSPSGHLCAMGSESGYITVFDMELLKRCEYGEDAIIQVISSTRPDLHGSTAGPGAIRTMQFSPAPWDLLVWSEDQARVCVADIRSDLKVKQILALDSKEEGLNKVHIADFDVELNPTLSNLQEEEDFIRRYRRTLDTEGNAAAVDLAYDHIDAERRQPQRHRGVVESDNDPHGLTAHERQVLEALRTTRQRDGSREQAPTPRSINYNTFATPALARREREAAREREATARHDMTDTFTDFVSESARHQHQRQEWRAPRRQASMVVSLDNNSSTDASSTNITGMATTRSPNPIPAQAHVTSSAQAHREHNEIVASTDEAWRTIEDALGRNSRAADNARSTASPELRNELRRLRQLTAMRERLRTARDPGTAGSYSLRNMGYPRPTPRLHHDPSHGVRTAGLAMSPDGRSLYCGTEDGIFEFHINVHSRKMAPAITPR